MPQNDGIMHVASGYRIFPDAEVSYTGVDFGLEYYITSDLSAWGNYSYISKNEFDGEDLGEGADSPLTTAFNTPKNKFRLGLTLTPETGFRGSISFQHDDSFLANTGQFGGPTEVKNLVDMSIGYKLDNGLSIDLSGNNIFNNEYRAFPNMPKIGAMYRMKLTYTFGAK
jgi:outer membrane receptor for ferrienterochelin and colicins